MNRAPNRRYLLWLTAAVAAIVLVVDLLVPLGVAAAVPYVAAVVLAYAAGSRRGVWLSAAVCSLLTFVGLFFSPSGDEMWKALANRTLALAAIWVTAAFCVRVLDLLAEQSQRAEAAEQTTADVARQREEEQRRSQALASIMEDLRLERERLKSSEQRTLATIESAPAAMVMVDAAGTIILVNAETKKLFGYARDEMIGQAVEMLVPERFRAGHPELRGGFFANPEARRMGISRDLFGLRKDGSEFPVEIGLNPVETEEGLFVLSAVVDITARKRQEDELKKYAADLERTNADLEEFNKLAVGRELRMIELEAEVNELCRERGEPPRYKVEYDTAQSPINA